MAIKVYLKSVNYRTGKHEKVLETKVKNYLKQPIEIRSIRNVLMIKVDMKN